MDEIDSDKYEPGVPYEESSVDEYEEPVKPINIIHIKCPVGPRELLMKYREVDKVVQVDEFNLMELMCWWCTRQERKKDATVRRVIHKYNLLAELVESEIERV